VSLAAEDDLFPKESFSQSAFRTFAARFR